MKIKRVGLIIVCGYDCMMDASGVKAITPQQTVIVDARVGDIIESENNNILLLERSYNGGLYRSRRRPLD